MTPDDARHGTTRGFHAGCRNTCCRRAIARDEKARRLDKLSGGRAVPALGAQRRLRALMALGWSTTAIAQHAGLNHRNGVLRIVNGQKGKPTTWLEKKTNDWVCAVYDQLSMQIPDGTYANRTRLYAQRQGWPPPLAYENIDDPQDTPTAWAYTPAWRGHTIHDLIDQGANLTTACRSLGLSINSLNSWCNNNGMSAEYRTLAGREGDWNSGGRIAHGETA